MGGNYFRSGMVTLLNQTRRYARLRTLTVRVTDRAGAPLPGAAVFFEILNACQWFPAARVPADRQGLTRLTCGRGSLRVRAVCGEWSAQGNYFGDAANRHPDSAGVGEAEISRDISVCPGLSYVVPGQKHPLSRCCPKEKAACRPGKRPQTPYRSYGAGRGSYGSGTSRRRTPASGSRQPGKIWQSFWKILPFPAP